MKKSNYHSRSYHKFFDQYAEKETFDDTGKLHIERIYVGNYYTLELTRTQRIFHRILYVLLYILSFACFLISGTGDVSANYAVIPSICVAVSLFALAILALPLIQNLIAPHEMIIRQYRASSLDFIRVSRNTSIILVITALVNLLFFAFTDGFSSQEALLYVGGYFVSAFITFLLHLLEKKTDYKVIPPRASRPEKSTIIQFESSVQHF